MSLQCQLTRSATCHARPPAPHLAPLLHRAHPGTHPRRAPQAPQAPQTSADACLQQGWLKTHRRDWYKHHLHINYSSRAATFSSTDRRGSRDRRLTGIDGPSTSALFQHSFPQPEDIEAEDEQPKNGQPAPASEDAPQPPGLQIPRGSAQKDQVQTPEEEEFVDAVSEPDEDLRVYTHQEEAGEGPSAPTPARRASSKSFVTASSVPISSPPDNQNEEAIPFPHQDQAQASGLQVPSVPGAGGSKSLGKRPLSTAESPTFGEPSVDAVSTTSLLRKADSQKASDPAPISPAKGILAKAKRKSEQGGSSDSNGSPLDRVGETISRRKSNLRNLVKFDIPEDSKRATIHLRAKQAQMTVQRASTKLRRRKIKDGVIVKMERMLIRVDEAGKDVPDDYDENESQRVDYRVKDKWREYMVVCRHSESDDADFVLQMYKTRVSTSSLLDVSRVDELGHSRNRRAECQQKRCLPDTTRPQDYQSQFVFLPG